MNLQQPSGCGPIDGHRQGDHHVAIGVQPARRFIELGTLRAIGLSTTQLTIFLICELAFLILLGLGLGTGIGVLISRVFIPYLQIGGGPALVLLLIDYNYQ